MFIYFISNYHYIKTLNNKIIFIFEIYLKFQLYRFYILIDFFFILIIRKSGFFIMIFLYFYLSCKTYVFTTFFIN